MSARLAIGGAAAFLFVAVALGAFGAHALRSKLAPDLMAVYQTHGAAAGMPISSVTFQYSDHQAFLDAGFPATGVGEEFVGGDHTPHYHEATDTVENVSFAHLAVVTHLALAVLEADATAL